MKNQNFKRILALVLSFVMILSLCTTSFIASAEDPAVDMTYYVLNDGTADNGSENNDFVRVGARMQDGKLLYRITPQSTQEVTIGMQNNIAIDSVNAAAATTLSYYVNNGTDVDLTYNYSYDTVGLGGGYVYLMDANSGELIPIKTADDGSVTIPAYFKGYVVYDISNAANYLDGVEAIKANAFAGMSIKVTHTSAMIAKAWYIGEFAVSNQTVENLAKHLTGAKLIAYNFNTAAKSGNGDESVYHVGTPGSWENQNEETNETQGVVVDFGSLEGKGRKFTVNADSTLHSDATYYPIRKSFRDSIGTNLPFAIENAKGYKFEIENNFSSGSFYHNVMDGIGGTTYNLLGTYYLVSEDGTVTEVPRSTPHGTQIPLGFKGTVYVVFDENPIAGTWASLTWADFVTDANGDGINLSFVTYSYTSVKGGANFSYGGFSLIYDVENIKDKIAGSGSGSIGSNEKNPVVIDGSVQGISERTGNAGTNSPSNFDVAYGEKYVVTYKGGIDASKDAMHDFFLYNGDQKMYIDNPSAVKGLSFKLKVKGKLPKFGMYLDDNGTCYYNGTIWAYDTTGTLVATKPDGGTFIFKNTLPEDFEGTIVIGVDNNKIVGGYGTFADHYAQHGGGFRGLKLAAAIPHDAVDGDFFMEYDDLRLIYDDLDTYTGSLRAAYEDTLNPIISDGSIMPSAFKNGGGTPALDKEFTFTVGDEIVATYSDDKATAYGRHIIYFNNGRPIGEIENYQNIQGFSFEFRNPNPEAIQFRLSTDYEGYGAYGGTMCAIDHDGNIVATQERIGTSVVNMLLIPAYFDGIIVADATKPGWHSQNATKMNDNFAGYYEDSEKKGGSYFATMGFEVTTKTDINIHKLGLTTFVYDDLRIIWQNIDEYIAGYADTQAAKAAKAEAAEREDTVKYYNTGAIVNETTFGESATTFADYIGKTDGFGTAPYYAAFDRPETVLGVGTAIKFTRSKLPLPEEDVALYINNKSTLDLEEIMNKDAAIFYAKIPSGQSVSLTRSFGEGFDIGTGTMAYDVVSKEITLFDGYSTDTLSGFEGYIIIPLADAFVGDYTFQEFIEGNEGFGGNYFTFAPDGLMNLTELWLGDFRLVDSGADFIKELGFDHMIGDVNGDKEYDVRDLVRLKKYNADYTVGIAYYNADIDQSGDVDSAAELVAARKELLTVIDVEGVYVAPEVGVGIFHSFYGEWDAKYNELMPENDLLNTYITTDVHEIAEIKKNNGSAWIQLGKLDRNNNPIFVDENGNPDTTVMKINPAYLAGLEATINTIQAAGVWDAVAGFTVEEILGATEYISADQFVYLTKYLRDTYHKRFFVCFSGYMVNGDDSLGIPAATPELYKYVTDMGYNMYYESEQKNRDMFKALKDNTGNRTDVKYWFYPTAYSGFDADGNPTRTDAEAAAQIEMYAKIFSEVPDSQKGGLLFYTMKTFTKSYGLDKLISVYDFELTAQALIDLATTYVK